MSGTLYRIGDGLIAGFEPPPLGWRWALHHPVLIPDLETLVGAARGTQQAQAG